MITITNPTPPHPVMKCHSCAKGKADHFLTVENSTDQRTFVIEIYLCETCVAALYIQAWARLHKSVESIDDSPQCSPCPSGEESPQ